MAYSKKLEFDKDEIKAAEIAKALSHPARVAIIKFLAEQKSCICNDIVEQLPLSQSTVSQHLKELKNAGLIKGEIDGPRVCYCIDMDNWKIAKNVFSDLFKMNFDSMKIKCC
ncbi:MAG: winged helix-turn-helix transcriptional regulator [Bacteroidia bacterium]|nr:winged helix-turn-helix transcriptional regulator [Bacteroidia bacterium]